MKFILQNNLQIMHHNLKPDEKKLNLGTKNAHSISVSVNKCFDCIILQSLKIQLYNSTIIVKMNICDIIFNPNFTKTKACKIFKFFSSTDYLLE